MPLNDNPDRIQAYLNSQFEGILSLAEFAEARGVEESTIRHAIRDGRLKPYVDVLKLGKQWIVSPHAWVALDGDHRRLTELRYSCHMAIRKINEAAGDDTGTLLS